MKPVLHNNTKNNGSGDRKVAWPAFVAAVAEAGAGAETAVFVSGMKTDYRSERKPLRPGGTCAASKESITAAAWQPAPAAKASSHAVCGVKALLVLRWKYFLKKMFHALMQRTKNRLT
jgi:peroxiredoxin family protein